ncbi:MAG TPA: hypothetical protein VGO62_02310, partial [Myxococcota bacterium]
AGSVAVVPFPDADGTTTAPILLGWPAVRELSEDDATLVGLFLDAFAGDESTPLYKKLIDGKTRTLETGATGVWGTLSHDEGEPIEIGLTGVAADKLTAKTVLDVRALVRAELAHVAALAPGDPELAALNARVLSRVVNWHRQSKKFIDTTPGFGFRGTGSAWFEELRGLAKEPGFRKSLTGKTHFERAAQIAQARDINPWRDRLRAWGLLDEPFAVAAKPSPQKRKALDAGRKARIDAELVRLEKQYGNSDAAAVLAKFQAEGDEKTAAIEAGSQSSALPPLVDHPPLTRDDDLVFAQKPIAGVPALHATFETMASTNVDLALRLDSVEPRDLFWLAVEPSLLMGAGVVDDGKAIAAEDVNERLRNEVLSVAINFDENLRTGRAELSLSGAGSDVKETRRAIAWMKLFLTSPNWSVENLPRLRDIVDQALTSQRQTMQGAEENWVGDPELAWWKQGSPLHMHVGSFLTSIHDLHRIKWMLAADPSDNTSRDDVARAFDQLAALPSPTRATALAAAAHLADGAHAPAATALLQSASAD